MFACIWFLPMPHMSAHVVWFQSPERLNRLLLSHSPYMMFWYWSCAPLSGIQTQHKAYICIYVSMKSCINKRSSTTKPSKYHQDNKRIQKATIPNKTIIFINNKHYTICTSQATTNKTKQNLFFWTRGLGSGCKPAIGSQTLCLKDLDISDPRIWSHLKAHTLKATNLFLHHWLWWSDVC